ncbi:MAG: pyridoxal phosphate-dependent class II aminotransferase [Desulfobacterales bacterium]|nr:pyridoxal phosphate-dependent class II aminotransferase [Desulfobacterales bacterium]
MINGHGGNIYDLARRLGRRPSEIIDMSSNVNPLGPLPGLIDFLKDRVEEINALPEVDARGAVKDFAARHRIDPDRVIAGNGTTQLIYTLPMAFRIRRALILGPTYSDYADACAMHGVEHDFFLTRAAASFTPDARRLSEAIPGFDTVFICNPNNPTGALFSSDSLTRLCETHPDVRFVVDESYLPFVKNGENKSMMTRGLSNVLTLNSMSKIFRVPGLRIGFAIGSGELVRALKSYMLPWSVSSMAQAAVTYLMSQKEETDRFIDRGRRFFEAERKNLKERLAPLSYLNVFPSQTSFMLAELSGPRTADAACDSLANHGILLRNCANFTGLTDKFIRISLKTRRVNEKLAEKLNELESFQGR